MILQDKGLLPANTRALIDWYAGNPLALKIASTPIQEVFGGDVTQFLAQDTGIFGDISDLLEQQVNRLTAFKRQVMLWLAIAREAAKHWATLRFSDQVLATEAAAWQAYLSGLGIVSAQAVRVITEAALLGGVLAQGIRDDLRILSDGAGQFNLLHHGLCWVHAERM